MRYLSVSILTLLTLLCGSALAQTWVTYNADDLPDVALGFTVENDSSDFVASGGILSVTATDNDKAKWRSTTQGFNNAVGWTVEFRLKATQGVDWQNEAEFIGIRDQAYEARWFFGDSGTGPDGVQIKELGQGANTFFDQTVDPAVASDTLYETRGWHTYRLVGEPTPSHVFVYRDGDLIGEAPYNRVRTEDRIQFGAINTADTIAYQLDWLRWAVDGAYHPTGAPVDSDPDPVLVNRDFDNIYDSDGDVGIANATIYGWTPFQVNSGTQYQYTYTKYVRHTNYSYAARISDQNVAFDGGVYQTVPATPNSLYTFTSWFNCYNGSSPADHQIWVGIDPNGGTDATSTDVVWSTAGTVGDSVSNAWQQAMTLAVANASQITLFVRGSMTPGGGAERDLYFDDADLVDNGPLAAGVESQYKAYR